MSAKTVFTDARFGKLVCLHRLPASGTNSRWMFRCDCGTEKPYYATRFQGKNKAWHCGCMGYGSHQTHAGNLYAIWLGMRARCSDEKNPRYGGRGIRVQAVWDDFDKFEAWANANGFARGLQIDRVDNDGSYGPDNCRFVTSRNNSLNTSRTTKVLYCGALVSLRELADKFDINIYTLRHRVFRMKIPIQIALQLPRNKWATRQYRASR